MPTSVPTSALPYIYNKVWQGERVCRRVTGCTRRVLVSCGMAVSVFLRCGRSLFVLGVDFRGAKLMFFFVKTHFLCFFHRICVGFCVRRRFCLAKTARNRGGDVCGWECGCARRGAAAFAVGSAVVCGEGRGRLRLGVRLCAERGGGVCGWECGCARRGTAAFAVGSAVVHGEGRRCLRALVGCVQNGSLYLLACLSSIMERYDWYLLGAMCCFSSASSTAHPGSLVCVQLLNRHSLACWKISGK